MVKVFGKEYKVKPYIPAIVPVMMARANDSMDPEMTARMLVRAGDTMFGPEAIDELCGAGLTTEQLGTLIKKTFDLINGENVDGEGEETISDEDGAVAAHEGKK